VGFDGLCYRSPSHSNQIPIYGMLKQYPTTISQRAIRHRMRALHARCDGENTGIIRKIFLDNSTLDQTRRPHEGAWNPNRPKAIEICVVGN